jgi:hypothetical protein
MGKPNPVKEQLADFLSDPEAVDIWGNEDYEYDDEPKVCPPGYMWCDKRKDCVPEHDRDLDMAVPEVGGEKVEEKQALRYVDTVLDEVENSLMNYPADNYPEEIKRLKRDLSGLKEMINNLREKGEYRDFFNSMLQKYGAEKPRDLPEDKRKEFFNAVNSAWKSKEERKMDAARQQGAAQAMSGQMGGMGMGGMGVAECGPGFKMITREDVRRMVNNAIRTIVKEEGEYDAYFKGMLQKWGVTSPSELPDEKKKEFFDAVNQGWKSEEESE